MDVPPPAANDPPDPLPELHPYDPPPPDASEPALYEDIPPAVPGQAVTRSQLRYCVFQNARLETARPFIDNYKQSAVDGFNASIRDFNERCGSMRYFVSDKSQVDAELAASEGMIASSGQELAGRLNNGE